MTNEETASYFEEIIKGADWVDASYTDGVKVEAIRTAFKALQERKTGKWVQRDIRNCYTVYRCSECGMDLTVFHRFCDMPSMTKVVEQYPYCHCGAKMEVDE